MLPVVVSLAAFQPSVSAARPANTLPDLYRTFEACARIPAPSRHWMGAELTVRFSIRRDGQLIGRPRITYSRLPVRSGEEKPFVAAALAALESCFPVEVTPGLGGAVAGRILTVRIGADPRSMREPPASHEATATMNVRRANIAEKVLTEIEALYCHERASEAT